jgi:hypothetical protein
MYSEKKELVISGKLLQHPFACMVAGPSQGGKSTLITKILENNQNLISPAPTRIIYCYGLWSDSYSKMEKTVPRIEFVCGLPDVESLNKNDNNLIILDDLIEKVENDVSMLNLFTKDVHHKNLSVFLLTQNIFTQGKYTRTISRNCQYLIVLDNPRDPSQIFHLARQMFPGKGNSNFLIKVYEEVMSKPYSYLFFDLRVSTPKALRVQANVFGDYKHRTIYKN